jgi:GTPase
MLLGRSSRGRLTVALIGRPNVGKSTLFNRLLGKPKALVADTPGVTRDWKSGDTVFYGVPLTVLDTAGQEEKGDDILQPQIQAQTRELIQDADVVLWIVDGRTGLLPDDRAIAQKLRRLRSGNPVAVVVNKCEGHAGRDTLAEVYGIGFGDPFPISAIHGDGLMELVLFLDGLWQTYYPPLPSLEADAENREYGETAENAEAADEAKEQERPLALAILGRPNVGKSTLVNQLLGEDRLLTGPQAGVTRDAIELPWSYRGKPIKLIDTAGLRKKGRITDELEKMAVRDSLQAVRFAHIVILVLDATQALEKQDLTLADHAIQEGRGLILAFNKWDQVKSPDRALDHLKERIETLLPQVKRLPFFTVSALTGRGLTALIKQAIRVQALLDTRVTTGALNRWLEEILENHTPPMVNGRRIKIKYITQVRMRPPTFALFGNQLDALAESYQRYLLNRLRETFHLWGIPLRLHLRNSKNPFAKKK